MFERLGDRLDGALKKLRQRGVITEKMLDEGLREVRRALLEADVNFRVARNFLAKVKERALGEDVLKSVRPGDQIVKIVHDELVALLGETAPEASEAAVPPTVIMLVGLQGSGKTTTAAKLGRRLATEGRRPGLVACDPYRPGGAGAAGGAGEAGGRPAPGAPERRGHGGTRARRAGRGEEGRGHAPAAGHGGPAAGGRGVAGRTASREGGRGAATGPARRRRDDGAGGSADRRGLPRRGGTHGGRPHEDGRRRPRGRGALDLQRARRADPVCRGRASGPRTSRSSIRSAWPAGSSRWGTSSASWSARSRRSTSARPSACRRRCWAGRESSISRTS